MIDPWTLVCFVAIWWKGRKSLGDRGGEKRILELTGGGGWQVVGGGPSGCYFLALADLAEFRGGVTGLPDPIPPPPP